MMRVAYWLAVVTTIAVITHIGMILYLPRVEMSRKIERAAAGEGFNAWTVVRENPQEVLGYDGGDAVYAFCPFDLTEGQLVVDAFMPAGLWSLSIYSARGNSVYAVNSRQAGVDNFQLTVRKAPGLISQIVGDADANAIKDGWQVETAEDRGMVVVWATVPEPYERPSVEADLARSSCRIANE